MNRHGYEFHESSPSICVVVRTTVNRVGMLEKLKVERSNTEIFKGVVMSNELLIRHEVLASGHPQRLPT